MRTPSHIMVHHSLTADSKTVSWSAIEKFHMETNGWRDVGYHAGVELVRDPAEVGVDYAWQALRGRADFMDAAACPQGDMNRRALHVCCVGNFDLAPPPAELLKCLVKRVLLPWMLQYNISPGMVVGHREYNSAKSCPGLLFDLPALRARLT